MSSTFFLSAAASTLAATGLANDQHQFEDFFAAPELEGAWRSDGYGYVLSIGPQGAWSLYHATDSHCVALTPQDDDPMQYFGAAEASGDRLVFRGSSDPYTISFNRMRGLPERCGSDPSSASPLDNFDAFVSYYRTHYAFFDVHNPDWLNMAAKFRAGLDEDSGEGDIIEPMIGLLSTLKDGHVSISAVVGGDEGEFIAYPGPTLSAVQGKWRGEGSPMAAFGRQYLRRDIEQATLGGEGRNAGNERIKYGITGDNIGYMAVMSVGGFTGKSNASEADELAALNMALDEVFTLFASAQVRAVMVDLSVNQGGYDFLGRTIASRFAQDRTLAYSKYAGDASDQTPQPIHIEPSSAPGFDGPVFVLTSDVTVSAAETLTLSLRALPSVTHVGARTRGALSDVLTKRLPNGWTVTLSNEVYRDSEGEIWEGRGIAPSVEYEVFDPENPFSGHMPAVERTLALIEERLDD